MTDLIMKSTRAALSLIAVLLGLTLSESALAWGHGAHVRFGVAVGGPLWWGPGYYAPYYYPPYYYPPYYYYPPVPAAPLVYLERSGAHTAAPAQPRNYWYYCAGAKGYYPYVKGCPGGWQRVAPQPK